SFKEGIRLMRGLPRPSGQRPRTTWIVWVLASLLFLFLAENIWIDPWLRHQSYQIPSLVPMALSRVWFLAIAIGGIALTLLLVSQVLLICDRTLSIWRKTGTGIAA